MSMECLQDSAISDLLRLVMQIKTLVSSKLVNGRWQLTTVASEYYHCASNRCSLDI